MSYSHMTFVMIYKRTNTASPSYLLKCLFANTTFEFLHYHKCIRIKIPHPYIAMLFKNITVDYIIIPILICKAVIFHIETKAKTNCIAKTTIIITHHFINFI